MTTAPSTTPNGVEDVVPTPSTPSDTNKLIFEALAEYGRRLDNAEAVHAILAGELDAVKAELAAIKGEA